MIQRQREEEQKGDWERSISDVVLEKFCNLICHLAQLLTLALTKEVQHELGLGSSSYNLSIIFLFKAVFKEV